MNLDSATRSVRKLMQASVGVGGLGRVRLVTVVIVVLAVLFPLMTGQFQVGLMVKFLIFAMFALSLDLMWGYSGILTLGHAGFFGLGAYAMALVLIHFARPGATYLGLLAAVILPALLAASMGYFLFYGKVGGMYFVIITLVVSTVLQQMAINFIGLTGGLNGLYPIPPLDIYIPGLADFEITGEIPLYYCMLVCLVVVFLLCWKIVNSGFGRLMEAIKGNETRTEYFGYNLANSKIAIFSLSCALAGMAGGLYAGAIGFISPDLLGIAMTTEVIVWVAVGGRGTLTGAILGTLLVNIVAFFLSGQVVTVWYLIMGSFLVAIVMFRPKGVMGYLS
jgi:urea transport system permease protein